MVHHQMVKPFHYYPVIFTLNLIFAGEVKTYREYTIIAIQPIGKIGMTRQMEKARRSSLFYSYRSGIRRRL